LKGLTTRLLIFNLLLAVFPIGAFLFLGTYESQLLESQERAMVQQGRLLAAALAGDDLKEEARTILGRLGDRTDARLRVVNSEGRLIADSAGAEVFVVPIDDAQADGSSPRPNAISVPEEETYDTAPSYPEESVIYRIGALPTRAYKSMARFIKPPVTSEGEAEYYSDRDILNGPELRSALDGRYGAATRISRGQKSVTLYSAIPVFRDEAVLGAVLVSRSTFAILSDLYQLRLDIAIIFLFSIGAAVVLSILLARTVTVPVGRLRDQAEGLLDKRGKLQARFKPLSGKDEVADLSRALYKLSSRLQQRTDYMEDFMADLAHEMKNPMASILSASELAEQISDPESIRFLKVIEREGRRIQRLLENLQELIDIDVRIEHERREAVDVGTILRNIVDGYPEQRKGQVSLKFVDKTETDRLIFVEADPDRLVQAVLNLVDNAISFSPRGETVEILLDKPRDGMVSIQIADRGPGIPAEAFQKVFERWYTDRPETNPVYHTGLGLAIVKGIAKGYEGHVTLRNRDGGGALFILEFPLVQ